MQKKIIERLEEMLKEARLTEASLKSMPQEDSFDRYISNKQEGVVNGIMECIDEIRRMKED